MDELVAAVESRWTIDFRTETARPRGTAETTTMEIKDKLGRRNNLAPTRHSIPFQYPATINTDHHNSGSSV